MLFSIPLFIVFSSLCLLTKQTEMKESDTKITGGHNSEQAGYVEEPMSNYKSKEIYKECRKNHASSIGGYALDGCCEFLPAGVEGTLDFFKCAACFCHKNFHRKEIVSRKPTQITYIPQPTPISMVFQTKNGYHHVTGPSRETTTAPAFPSAVIHDEAHFHDTDPINGGSSGGGEGSLSSKKRFRTKFSHEQKEQMLDFAVQIGWRIKKQDQNVVEMFCNKIGVKFQVFKVWMQNNRHTIGKKP
ncbi:zinc-finger homeodomain protein [Trifolium repens]|jgi:ZF-HD class homeobox domain-containing protein|nr:zinc-finger homeodomain protein [Trifolium repens]